MRLSWGLSLTHEHLLTRFKRFRFFSPSPCVLGHGALAWILEIIDTYRPHTILVINVIAHDIAHDIAHAY